MTKTLLIAACVLCGLSQNVCAQDRRHQPAPFELPHAAAPAAAGHAADPSEARGSIPLRESLRQSWLESEDRPYRLSSEERHRMREQLRAQALALEAASK